MRQNWVRVVSMMVWALAAMCLLQAGARAADEWKPERAVTIYCSTGAGGLTDIGNRALAAAFRDYFGVPFNVNNMMGGGGGVAGNHVYNLPRDGYALLGISDAMHGWAVRGAFNHSNDVWDCLIMSSGRGAISVSADSPYKTLEELMEAAKTTKLKAGASQTGCVWYVKLIQANQVAGTEMTIVPFEGSNATLVGLLSGEIDVALVGVAEQEDYIRAGKVRPLAMIDLGSMDLTGYGHIPGITETYPEFANLKQANQHGGVALPADTPKEIVDAYTKAFKAAMDSKPVHDFAATRTVDLPGLVGADAKKMISENDSVFAWTLDALNLTVKSPEEFNIPRP